MEKLYLEWTFLRASCGAAWRQWQDDDHPITLWRAVPGVSAPPSAQPKLLAQLLRELPNDQRMGLRQIGRELGVRQRGIADKLRPFGPCQIGRRSCNAVLDQHRIGHV